MALCSTIESVVRLSLLIFLVPWVPHWLEQQVKWCGCVRRIGMPYKTPHVLLVLALSVSQVGARPLLKVGPTLPPHTEQCGYDHAPVTRGRMRAQFPLPHGPPGGGGLLWFWAIWPKVPTPPQGGGGRGGRVRNLDGPDTATG